MKKEDILSRIGLTGHQSDVYLSLVELGPSLVAKISEQTGLHRPTVYQALHELELSGLVTTSPRGKQKLYNAEPPEKLQGLLTHLAENFSSILPQLNKAYSSHSKKPIVKYLTGRAGIQFVYADIIETLPKDGVFYRFSSRKDTTRGDYYLPPNYRKIRDQKRLQRFVISNVPASRLKKPRLERALKVIPPKYDLFAYDITEIIYSDKIAYIDYNTETAFIVENPLVAEFQRKIFKLMYELL